MKMTNISAQLGKLFNAVPAVAGAVAVLAFAPAAQAVVVVSPAANVTVPATTAGVYINVVSGANSAVPANAPGWDVNAWGSTTLNFFTNTAAGSAYVAATTTGTPVALTAGTTIGPGSVFSSSGSAVTFGAAAGNWSLNSTNYFGFRFIGDDTSLHYGYGTMIVGATAATRSIGQLFYESTPNMEITVAVPEVSSLAMMLLGGLGLAGAMARRRKQAA